MFQTVHYEIKTEKIKRPVTIAMLADLHNHLYGQKNEKLLAEIKNNRPDLICLAGDMLIGHSRIPYETAQELVLALAKEYPVFYGLGNHEARMKHQPEIYGERYHDYMAPLLEAGVHILCNERQEFWLNGSRFLVYGYDLPMKYFEKFNRYEFSKQQLLEALGDCSSDDHTFCVLLAHNPVYFPQYAAWGADLTLSGHLHGGIIRLPLIGGLITPQAKLFPRYSAGLYKKENCRMIVSRGLGTHTVPIRIFNRPELSIIHLLKG